MGMALGLPWEPRRRSAARSTTPPGPVARAARGYLAGFAGTLQADADSDYNTLHLPDQLHLN
jgi:hypothetical protein